MDIKVAIRYIKVEEELQNIQGKREWGCRQPNQKDLDVACDDE